MLRAPRKLVNKVVTDNDHWVRNHAMARSTAAWPVHDSSGIMALPYAVPVRSAISAVVSSSIAPSLRRYEPFAVDSPHVAAPKLRVCGLARNAIAIASPELATRLSVRTATRGDDRIRT